MKLNDFDFELPESAIAQQPITPRDAAKLLHVRGNGLSDRRIGDLAELLKPGDILVINNSKVIPARLFGKRGMMNIEILLHRRIAENEWEVFARPLKRLRIGNQIMFAENFSATVSGIRDDGLAEITFDMPSQGMMEKIMRHGHMPLPPYIKRPKDGSADSAEDRQRYQTVYARHEGSVAAPTAGLHFTENLLARLKDKGVQLAEVTLHVGAGTFQPVKTESIAEHKMHAEWASLGPDVAEKINAARATGGRVIAVGTTVARVLESVAGEDGILKAWQGETRIFITPGYRFKVVDALLTNFHLPKSTLFMLVCAFAGMVQMKKSYHHAIQNGYRFYSYGDACFLEKKNNESS